MTVDTIVVESYVQLTNYFAAEFGRDAESISSVSDLWQKQGNMISEMMQCDTKIFRSADLFYEVLHRKIRLVNGSLAEALDPKEAASGNLLEICKFYALFLEFLRKDHSDLLTNVLERLAAQSGFNSTVLLDTFAHFDKLYAEDTVDEWWSCLIRTDDTEILSGLRTPTRNNFSTSAFATPTATARRLRTATSTARRSPIAEAVDSPTMKYMRSERELKQAKNRIREAEQHAEDLEHDNRELKDENRKLKMTVDTLKADIAGKRASAQDSELRTQETSAALEAKQREAEMLAQQLEDCRTALRTEQRHLEESEAEKEKLTSKLATASEDLEKCMKEMRKLRDTNEQEFLGYRQKDREHDEKYRAVTRENLHLTEHVNSLENERTSLQAENSRLSDTVEELSLTSARFKQDADNAKTQLSEERERLEKAMETLQKEHMERMKMSDSTIDRIQKELERERKDKNDLRLLLNEVNEKALNTDRASHERSEGILSAKACLEGAKKRIEQLEVDLRGKEAMNAIFERQIEQSKAILQNEVVIREQSNAQHLKKKGELEDQLNKKDEEINLLRENMQSLVVKHQNKLEEQESAMKASEKKIDELTQLVDTLTTTSSEVGQKNHFLQDRIKLLENMRRSPISRVSSPDSLLEFVAKEEPEETEEESRRIIEQTPRKSVAFSVDMNMGERGTPIGFKPRDSISSDCFERNSLARSSIISDTLTIGSNQDFKTPFTPGETTSERVSVLKSRNERVAPHLQSAYSTEMGNINSPSANEENVRKGGAGEPKKKRRDSILSSFFKK